MGDKGFRGFRDAVTESCYDEKMIVGDGESLESFD